MPRYRRPSLLRLRADRRLRIAASLDFCAPSWHSQTVKTDHPSRRSRLVFRASLALFTLNFSVHIAEFCPGILPFWHECACQ